MVITQLGTGFLFFIIIITIIMLFLMRISFNLVILHSNNIVLVAGNYLMSYIRSDRNFCIKLCNWPKKRITFEWINWVFSLSKSWRGDRGDSAFIMSILESCNYKLSGVKVLIFYIIIIQMFQPLAPFPLFVAPSIQAIYVVDYFHLLRTE